MHPASKRYRSPAARIAIFALKHGPERLSVRAATTVPHESSATGPAGAEAGPQCQGRHRHAGGPVVEGTGPRRKSWHVRLKQRHSPSRSARRCALSTTAGDARPMRRSTGSFMPKTAVGCAGTWHTHFAHARRCALRTGPALGRPRGRIGIGRDHQHGQHQRILPRQRTGRYPDSGQGIGLLGAATVACLPPWSRRHRRHDPAAPARRPRRRQAGGGGCEEGALPGSLNALWPGTMAPGWPATPGPAAMACACASAIRTPLTARTNQNGHGVPRRYSPQGCRPLRLAPEIPGQVAAELDARLRKSHGFRTPAWTPDAP